ncbi:MAG: hypothetical protein HOW73_37155 [Polyangiaceae bacterium]|nr:hypothetical protein [Polyangiaceae bacterium]
MQRRWLLGGAVGIGAGWVLANGVYRRMGSSARPADGGVTDVRTDGQSGISEQASGTACTSPLVASPKPARHSGPTDVTFLLISDLHFGAYMNGEPLEPVVYRAVDAMNELRGLTYPSALGGRVGDIRGVLAAGDLTEDGRPWEWNRFVETMGLTGKEGRLRYPMFESLGNHDGNDESKSVRRGIEGRHGSIHYAWSWDALRIYCLSDGPDDDILDWMQTDLATLPPETKILVYQHFPLAGSYSTGTWFGDGDYRQKLGRVLEGHDVLGIFHGHFHATGHYRFRGHDVYLAGSPKHSWRSFLVVRVTDERMQVAAYNYERSIWWWWHDKPLIPQGTPERFHYPSDAQFVRA